MQVIINGIEYQANNIVVNCDLGIGTLKGIWKGENPPVLNSHYYVEFTLDDISLNQTKVFPKNQEFNISVNLQSDDVFFTGICENYDGEVYYIRFEDDWLQMLYIKEDTQSIHTGNNILFWINYNQVLIYPYDIS